MIYIIGAGPAGCYTAYFLAKAGNKVKVFEEHREIGKPVQCTGLVTNHISEILRDDEFKKTIANEINSAKIVAPNGTSAEIKLNECVIDRKKFDRYLASKAAKAGSEIHTTHKFIGIKNNELIFENNKVIKLIRLNKDDVLIGADGPNSCVAKSTGLFNKRKFLLGMQAIVESNGFKKNIFEAHFGNICQGFFAWAVPESGKRIRIGLATKTTINARLHFERFIKDQLKDSKFRIVEKQAGLIPIYYPRQKLQKTINNYKVYLVGDAAAQTKATTGGGIIQGLLASRILADSIINGKDYQKEFKKKLALDLWLHLKIRQTLNKFSDKDYNYLISLIKKEKVKKILQSHHREMPSKFILKLVIAEPRFLCFFFRMLL